MNVRNESLINEFYKDVRNELKKGIYLDEDLSQEQIKSLIYLCYDVAEIDTSYNCDQCDDVSIIVVKYIGYDKNLVDKKVLLKGKDYERVRDILEYLYKYYTLKYDDIYNDYEVLKVSLESFLKKILHLLEKANYTGNLTQYGSLEDGTKGFTLRPAYEKVIAFYNLSGEVKQKRKSLMHDVVGARNTVHKKEDLGMREIIQKMHEMFIVMLLAVYDNQSSLKKIVDEYRNSHIWSINEKREYLQQIISNYENSDIYDSTNRRERYVELRVKPEGKAHAVIGTHKSHVEQNLPHYIMLFGTAGTGKTTIVNHFEYHDALRCLEGLNQRPSQYFPVPAKISFGNLAGTSRGNVLKNVLCKKLNILMDQLESLLEKGELNLYFDALDEIISTNNFSKNIKIELANIIRNYPNCFMFITGRKKIDFPAGENFEKVMCQLVSMNDEEREKLIASYSPNKEVEDKMVSLISNSAFKSIFETPLFIKMMADSISLSGIVPQGEYDLIETYLTNLFKREITKSHDDSISVNTMLQLLTAIHPINFAEKDFKKTEDSEESLYILPEQHVIEQFAEYNNKYHLSNFYPNNILNKMIELKVLERKDELSVAYANFEIQSHFG